MNRQFPLGVARLIVLAGFMVAVRVCPAFDQTDRSGNQLNAFIADTEKNSPFFLTLVSLDVPSPEGAKSVALRNCVKGFGLHDYQAIRVIGLFRVGTIGEQGIPGFAAAGDWIWEVLIGPPAHWMI
jgi:hypothetical protein